MKNEAMRAVRVKDEEEETENKSNAKMQEGA